MSYIDQSLGPDERIIQRAHLAELYRLVAWLTIAAALSLAVSGMAYLQHRAPSMLVVTLAVLAGVVAFVVLMMPIWTTEIAVTNQRLIYKQGLFTRSSEELQLWSVEQVDWQQGLLDRVFGFGQLVIAGTGDDAMHVPTIARALAFRQAVQRAITGARQGANASTAAKPA